MRKIKSVLLCVLTVIFIASISWAKPEPPKELNEMLDIFSEFEEKYEEGKWDESLKDINEITAKFKKTKDYLDKFSDTKKTSEISIVLNKLHKAVSSKNEKETEVEYINLQKRIFLIMDDYNYKTHPVFIVMEKYISDEAVEAAEKGNYEGVEDEMTEVAKISANITFLFAKRQVPIEKISNFNSKIQAVITACKQSKKADVINELKNLKEAFDSLKVK